MNETKILYGVIVVLIIVLIIAYFMHGFMWDKYMEGMWKSTDEFADEASIDVAWMYLGDKTAHHTRLGYLVMYADEQIIFNKKFQLKLFPGISMISPVVRSARLVFDKPDDHIPEDLTMNLDLIGGKLILYDSEQVYLSMIKNNEDSEYGKLLLAEKNI